MLIVLPAALLVLGTATAVTSVMNYYASTMDMFFGKGEEVLTPLSGTEDWNTNYYGPVPSSDDAVTNSETVAKEISDEGIVLLKNEGAALPLSSTANVTPLGRSFIDPIYGGNGSGNVDVAQSYVVTPSKALARVFGKHLNSTVADHLGDVLSENKYKRGSIGMSSSTYQIGEFPVSEYTAVENTFADFGDAGIVFLARGGGEGGDLTHDMSKSGGEMGQHQLELDANEKALIHYAETNFRKTIVVLNMSTSLELGELATDNKVSAILWMGSPGATGFSSLADVLVGNVNPSGRTVDTFAADFTKDPTWGNFGNFSYTNCSAGGYGGSSTPGATYVEYEEGIYVGYRYYETAYHAYGDSFYDAWKESSDKKTGTGVVYPFGYGLSYTDFSQEITNEKISDGKIAFDVKVTNTGMAEGKDAVEIYDVAPYSSAETIEEPYVSLIDFAKSDSLKPGESQSISFSIRAEDMASYDYKTEKAYVLSAGQYAIKLMANAHEAVEGQEIDYNVPEKIVYSSSNPRESEIKAQSVMNRDGSYGNKPADGVSYVAAANAFDGMNEYADKTGGMTNLSRADMAGTFPTAADSKKEAPDAVVKDFESFNVDTDPELGNTEGSAVYAKSKPVTKANNGLSLVDLRGVNYNDDSWNKFLDQLSYSDDELKVTCGANYQTIELTSLGKPATEDHDGPQGLTGTYGTGQKINAFAWPSEPLVAATFNTALGRKMGESIGKEALASGISGWYGPGLNIHRSPFGGRNFEYYSEDPVLCGNFGAEVIGGAGDSGLYAYVKHFAMNEQETNRLRNLCVWANEQTVREIYLKPFEIAVKNAKCTIHYIADKQGSIKSATMRAATAVMSSFNRIGGTLTCESYPLLTSVLRSEWGFQGMVVTDMMGGLNYDKKLRAGNDLNMDGKSVLSVSDKSSATALSAYRKAIKNICYAVANSNAMDGIAPGTLVAYKTSPWKIGLIIGDVIAYSLAAAGIGWVIYRIIDKRRKPEKYK